MQKTKIVCTLSNKLSRQNIKDMIEKGMNVARLNFSHSTYQDALQLIELLRDIQKDMEIPLAIMMDTKGPEVRIYGQNENVFLESGTIIKVESYTESDIADKISGINTSFYTNLPHIGKFVQQGDSVLLMDGFISGEITETTDDSIAVKIKNKGNLRPKAHLTIPSLDYPLPFLSEKDREDIRFAVKQDLDYIALSFVREKQDILDVKNLILDADINSRIKLISKIENKQAIENFESIMQLSDGIMVARGDLGVELPLEEVPVRQKEIIRRCYQSGKPVITATQMLESMIENPVPTRAEASDVANACYDLTSSVMLSGETAIGQYPVLVVETMQNIIKRVESAFDYRKYFYQRAIDFPKTNLTTIISYNAISTAYQCQAAALVVHTMSGYTARMLSKLRSGLPIYAFTTEKKVYNQLSLNWGVHPCLIDKATNFEDLVKLSMDTCLKKNWLKRGDLIVVVAGLPLGTRGTTNMIRIETVGKATLKGKVIHPGKSEAPIVFIKSYNDISLKDINDKIVVLNTFKKEYTPFLKYASGIIIETSAYEHELSLLGLAYGIPVLSRVQDAFSRLNEDTVISMNADKGIIIDI